MAQAQITASNPFALMMDPDAVLKAIEHSDRLECLQRRICRPLDRPMIPKKGNADQARFDQEVEAAADEDGAEAA